MVYSASGVDLDTNKIRDWRSIVTLIVFIVTSKYFVVVTLPVFF